MTSRTTSFSCAPRPIFAAVAEALLWASLSADARCAVESWTADAPVARSGCALAEPAWTPTATMAAEATSAAARRVFLRGVDEIRLNSVSLVRAAASRPKKRPGSRGVGCPVEH